MKIKHFIVFAFFAAIPFSIHSQEKKITLDLSKEKKSTLLQVIDVDSTNWLFYTGKISGMNKNNIDSKLSLYSEEGQLEWEVPVERKANDQWGKINLITTGDFVYHVEKIAKYPSLGVYKELFITIVPVSGGQARTAYFQDVQNIIQNEVGYFATGRQICFINYNYQSNENAAYYLHQLNIETKQTKEIKLNLPVIREEDKKNWYPQWFFIGEKDGLLYFYSKELKQNESEQSLIYHLLKVKTDGSLSDQSDIALHPDKNRFFSPCDQIHPGIDHIPDLFTFKRTNASSNGGFVYTPNIGSFGDIYVDLAREQLFAYGLFNYNKPYKFSVGTNLLSMSQQAEYAGFYVYKYDLAGKPLWQVNYDFPEELKQTDKRLIKNVAYDNQSLLKLFNNNQFMIVELLTFNGIGKNTDPNDFRFYMEDNVAEPLQITGQQYVDGGGTIFFSKKYSTKEIPLNEGEILTKLNAANKDKNISYSIIRGKKSLLVQAFNQKENKYVYTAVAP